MSRPKGNTPRLIPFSIAIDPRELPRLTARCKILQRSASWIVRESLRHYLDAAVDEGARRSPPPLLDAPSARRSRRAR